ncbi:MAG: histidine phosphatase family protein [Verrucomicrobiota bacterium]
MHHLLIRHGESEANAGLPTQSPSCIPLTKQGHRQARDLADSFTEAPELIVVSPFLRTQQTAAPLIARFPQVPVETWHVHEYTYLNHQKYARTTEIERGVYAKDYWDRCDPLWDDGGGAESFAGLVTRIDAALHKLSQYSGHHLAVFTHGYFIKALLLRQEFPGHEADAAMMAVFRDSRKNEHLPNAGIIRLLTCRSAAGPQI